VRNYGVVAKAPTIAHVPPAAVLLLQHLRWRQGVDPHSDLLVRLWWGQSDRLRIMV
jgi:hypothetical protein